jgi:hypothetical protein
MVKRLVFLLSLLALPVMLLAQEDEFPFIGGPGERAKPHKVEKPDPNPHPAIPEETDWANVVILLIGGLFAAAIPIGVIVRCNMSDEPPPAHDDHHGHDEHGHDAHGHTPAAGGHH